MHGQKFSQIFAKHVVAQVAQPILLFGRITCPTTILLAK